MKNNVETQLRRLLRKTSGLDIMVLRLSVIFIGTVANSRW